MELRSKEQAQSAASMDVIGVSLDFSGVDQQLSGFHPIGNSRPRPVVDDGWQEMTINVLSLDAQHYLSCLRTVYSDFICVP